MIAKSGPASKTMSSKYAWTHTKAAESAVSTSVSGSGSVSQKPGGGSEALGETPSADNDWLNWRGGFNDDLAKQVYAGLGLGNISPPLSPNPAAAASTAAEKPPGPPAPAAPDQSEPEGPQGGGSLDDALKRERAAQKSFSSQLLEKLRTGG